MAKKAGTKLKITLRKSSIAKPAKQKAVLAGLGLRKVNGSVERIDTPELRGMINKVSHLVEVEQL